jgi:hypothetical protein
MKEVIGNMNKQLISFCLILAFPVLTDENAIYVQQSGDNANIDLEQVSGTSNIIGGSESEAGDLTALILSGSSMTLDINQIGASNIFRSDSITGDNFTGFFEFDGNSNQFHITMNSTGLISADFINANVDVTGDSNVFDLALAENADTSYLDLDWIITGGSNQFDFDIDYSNAINFVDVNGSSNQINFSGSGYGGTTSADSGYFYLDLDGSSNEINITQESILARDYLKLTTNSSNSNICISQSDSGTSTSC